MDILELIDNIKLLNEYNATLSVLLFIATHLVFAIFFVPCSPMTTLAGVLWGYYGVIYALMASLLSSFSTFLLSRYFLHDYFYKKYHNNKKYIWLNEMTKKYSWKIIATTQLNPIVPASTLGYFYGLSQIKFKDYVLFSFIFSLPLTFALVFLGSSVLEILKGNIMTFMLFVSIIIVALVIFHVIKKKIKLSRYT